MTKDGKIRILSMLILLCLSTTILAFSTPRTLRQSSVYRYHQRNFNTKRTGTLQTLHSSTQNDSSRFVSGSGSGSFSGRNHRQPKIHFERKNSSPNRKPPANRRRKRTPAEIQNNLRRAEEVEYRLSRALEDLRRETTRIMTSSSTTQKEISDQQDTTEAGTECTISISFPNVRDCNGALAAFGDAGDLKRALRLYGQMRNSVRLVNAYVSKSSSMSAEDGDTYESSSRLFLCPPSPTLVTYSTLMSRAVSSGKEIVALRLWRLMISSPSYFANKSKSDPSNSDRAHDTQNFQAPIVPDIRAVNILMNVFSKIGDQASAQMLMNQIHYGRVEPYDDSMGKNGMKFTTTEGEHENENENSPLIKVVPKMKPNIVTYNTLIDACHRAGDLDAGLAVLNHMKENTTFKPDAMTYTSLISTVARRATKSSGKSDPDLAFSLFDEMVHVLNIRPNGMTYCALIDVCGRCRRSDLALKGKCLQELGPRGKSF